jgi:hypothetical protein
MKTMSQKRAEAQARQAEYDSLTTAQKVERAKSRRGRSIKEITRLKGKLEG